MPGALRVGEWCCCIIDSGERKKHVGLTGVVVVREDDIGAEAAAWTDGDDGASQGR